MEPMLAPKTIEVYMLLKQTGLTFMPVTTGANSLGTGFYSTSKEAEYQRTLEIIRDESAIGPKSKFHIFELTVPNPGYKKED